MSEDWHRWNWTDLKGAILFCRGEHHRSHDCEWESLTVEQVKEMAAENKELSDFVDLVNRELPKINSRFEEWLT